MCLRERQRRCSMVAHLQPQTLHFKFRWIADQPRLYEGRPPQQFCCLGSNRSRNQERWRRLSTARKETQGCLQPCFPTILGPGTRREPQRTASPGGMRSRWRSPKTHGRVGSHQQPAMQTKCWPRLGSGPASLDGASPCRARGFFGGPSKAGSRGRELRPTDRPGRCELQSSPVLREGRSRPLPRRPRRHRHDLRFKLLEVNDHGYDGGIFMLENHQHNPMYFTRCPYQM